MKKLNIDQIRRIDALLASLGDYGEINLIVQHGELRCINKVESYRAWKDNDKGRAGEQGAAPKVALGGCPAGRQRMGPEWMMQKI